MKRIFITIIASMLFIPVLFSQQSIELSKMKSSFEKRKPALDVMSANPNDYNLSYKTFKVLTTDSIQIASWFIPNELKKGSILMVHGFNMNKSHMLERASTFYKNGYSVLLLDLRARGESGGEKANTGKGNGLEVAEVYQYYLKHFSSYGDMTLYGFSHGGRAVIFGAGLIGQVAGLVLESPPYQLGESFKRQYRMAQAPKISEVPIQESLKSIANTPILLLIGDSDTAIIETEANQLIEYSDHEQSKVVVFENTKHHVYSKENMVDFENIVFDFLLNI